MRRTLLGSPRGKSSFMNRGLFLVSRSAQPHATEDQVSVGPLLVEGLVLNIRLPANFSDSNPTSTRLHCVHPTARTARNV